MVVLSGRYGAKEAGFKRLGGVKLLRVRDHRGLAALAIAVLFAAIASVAMLGSGPAGAYTAEGTQSDRCIGETMAHRVVLEEGAGNLTPAGGAIVESGSPIAFTGQSTVPLTFAVSSSLALMSAADIDSGAGVLQPDGDYAFTSTKASMNPGILYWDVSFSTAGLKDCQGEAPQVITTDARTLTVVPVKALTPPTVTLTPSPAPTPPFQVRISALRRFDLLHPTVSYSIHCTQVCYGETYYQLVVVRSHRKGLRASKLDHGPEPVWIGAIDGGSQQFSHRYSGSALQTLAAILHSGGSVEVQVHAEATDATRAAMRANRTEQLRT